MFGDLIKSIIGETTECVTQCRADIRKAGDHARSDEGRAIRTNANAIKKNYARDRKAFEQYIAGTISGTEYKAILEC